MQQNSRKIIKTTVNISDTPEKLRDLLNIASQVLNTDAISGGIHGGCAKALLGWILEREKIIESSTALNIFLNGETDLDMVMIKNEDETIDSLEKRFNAYQAGFKESKFDLRPDDIFVKEAKNIEEILKDNDLTINEVYTIPSEAGVFSIYYTDICLRDTISETGILTGNKAMTTRMHLGQKYPTNFGVFRLINALAKKRVKRIYLPARWVEAINSEAVRMQTEKFGIYGLLLTEKFKNNISAQEELMKILFDFSITGIREFSIYKQEQELLFQRRSNGVEFVLEDKRSFREIQEYLKDKETEGKKSREIRNQAKKTCSHLIEEMICDGCIDKCRLQKCAKCTMTNTIPPWSKKYVNLKSLQCNQNWEKSNFGWDEKGFYP